MLHESDKVAQLNIYNASISFENVFQHNDFPQDVMENIKNADILLLPQEDFKGYKNVFPEQTYRLYSYLTEKVAGTNLSIEICATDEDYKELELHADVVNICEILIQWALLPVVTGLISSYLYDLVKQNKKKMNANIKISVEKKGKTKTINFEGDIENFEKAMKSVKENIFDE